MKKVVIPSYKVSKTLILLHPSFSFSIENVYNEASVYLTVS